MRVNGSMVSDEKHVMALEAGDVRGLRTLHVVEPLVTGAAGAGWAVTPPGVPASGPPAGRPGCVARPGLVDRLEESVAAKLALVVAPAGWGKTSLLREWWLAGDRSGRAWLSVEAAHNDPARFWSAVIAALGTVVPGIDAAAVEALGRDGAAGCVEPVLLGHLAGVPERVTLVLDDFHLITSPEVLGCFGFWVERLPPSVGVVVAARSDPALPLARLRAQGELAEIRAGELAFSEPEAAQLLGGMAGAGLPAEQVRVLWQQTEGWAAGLYLAGLALRERKDGDLAGFVRGFAGDDRHIVDYLAAEVLGGLPPRVRSFLLRTCVLGRLSGPLCDAVTGSGGSQGLLEEIERAQLFVVPLDNTRRWYRYRGLFAEALRGELDRSEPGLAALLHRRAAAWYRQHGPVTEAIGHAIDAGDLADARELIAAHWAEVLGQGLAGMLLSWLEQLPPELVAADARMCLIGAVAACQAGRPKEAGPWLAAAEAAAPAGPLPDGPGCVESGVALVRAGCHHVAGDLAAAEAAARRAAELELDAGAAPWQAAALAMLGAVLSWRGRDGDAEPLLEQVTRPAHPPAGALARLLALGCLAAIAARRGDGDAAARHAREAAALATSHRLASHWATVTADLTMAGLLADRGDLAAAEATAAAALGHAQQHRARLETAAALLTLAAIATRAGRDADARDRISQAAAVIAQCPDPGILAGQLTAAQHQAALPAPAPAPRPHPPHRRPDRPRGRGPPAANHRQHQHRDRRRPRGQRPHRRTAPAKRLPQDPRPQPCRRRRLHGPPRQLTPPRTGRSGAYYAVGRLVGTPPGT